MITMPQSGLLIRVDGCSTHDFEVLRFCASRPIVYAKLVLTRVLVAGSGGGLLQKQRSDALLLAPIARVHPLAFPPPVRSPYPRGLSMLFPFRL